MTQEEIDKMANEYAEWYAPAKDYTEFSELRETDMCIARDDMKQCLKWLCREYDIVKKKHG